MKNYKFIASLFLFSYAITIMSCSKPKEYCSFGVMNNTGVLITLVTNTNSVYATIPSDGKRYNLDGPFYGGTTLKSIPISTPRLSSPFKVVFDSKDTVYHYNDEEAHTGKYLNKIQQRSLFNAVSYKIENTKAGEVGLYTFTKEDWDFAK